MSREKSNIYHQFFITQSNAAEEKNIIQTGFAMEIAPQIKPDGVFFMQYSLDLSDLESWKYSTQNGKTFQTPIISKQNILASTSLNSGEKLIISGLQQSTEPSEKHFNTQLVVVITPEVE